MIMDNLTLPAFPIIILLMAIVTRIVVCTNWNDSSERPIKGVRSGGRIVILVCMDASDPWREYLNHIVMRSREVATVNVLLTYRSSDQVPDHDVADPIYRHLVNIEMGIQRSRHPSNVIQRLVRRFVTGSEECVVVMQAGCTLHDDFARTITNVCKQIPPDGVVSCPTAHATGVAQFPTLRVRSNGSIARDISRPFNGNGIQHDVELVPSVTWCPEMTISSGPLLKRWTETTSPSFSEHLKRHPEIVHLVPSHPLLSHNTRVEDDVVDFDEGMEGERITEAERVGITTLSSSNERLVKYGTLFRARVAIESIRD